MRTRALRGALRALLLAAAAWIFCSPAAVAQVLNFGTYTVALDEPQDQVIAKIAKQGFGVTPASDGKDVYFITEGEKRVIVGYFGTARGRINWVKRSWGPSGTEAHELARTIFNLLSSEPKGSAATISTSTESEPEQETKYIYVRFPNSKRRIVIEHSRYSGKGGYPSEHAWVYEEIFR